MDAIEPVNGPTTWVSPVLAVPKENKDEIRLVQDMRKVNTAIQRSHKPIPTFEELMEKVCVHNYFLDLLPINILNNRYAE